MSLANVLHHPWAWQDWQLQSLRSVTQLSRCSSIVNLLLRDCVLLHICRRTHIFSLKPSRCFPCLLALFFSISIILSVGALNLCLCVYLLSRVRCSSFAVWMANRACLLVGWVGVHVNIMQKCRVSEFVVCSVSVKVVSHVGGVVVSKKGMFQNW